MLSNFLVSKRRALFLLSVLCVLFYGSAALICFYTNHIVLFYAFVGVGFLDYVLSYFAYTVLKNFSERQ